MSTYFFNGIPCTFTNRTTSTSADFYTSFQPDVSDYGCQTTAVVVEPHMHQVYVLCGDHQKGLAGKSFAEALDYLHDHAEQLHKYSDPLPPRNSTIKAILSVPRPKLPCNR